MLSDTALVELFEREGAVAAEAAARALLSGTSEDRPLVVRVLGAALLKQGRLEEALAVQATLLGARTSIDDVVNFALTLSRLGRVQDATTYLRLAVAADPTHPIAPLNLGEVLMGAGRLAEAEEVLSNALRYHPRDPSLLTNRGNARMALGDVAGAEIDYRAAQGLGERGPELANGLGLVLLAQERLSEAEAMFRLVLEARPDFVSASTNLAQCLVASGRAEEALAQIRAAIEYGPSDPTAHGVLMMLGNYLPDWSTEDTLAAGRGFEAAMRRAVGPATEPPPRRPGARLRVGLVSGDLRAHPVGYFLRTVLGHARQAVDFHAYPTIPIVDSVTDDLRASCQAWTPIHGMTDAEAAGRIRDDQIEVLVDLAGHTEYNRLGVFALRAAPVQASWLGYSATTGLTTMDYFIGDDIVAPVEEQARFVETLVRLPASYLCYSPPTDAPEVAPTPARSKGYVTFGCFNKLSKLNPRVVETWSRILKASPDARLILQTRQLQDAGTAARVESWFKAHGVGERVILRGAKARQAYFSDFADIDILLDPFPFPGGTTTFDALWMGVPTVTLRGDRFLARAGASFARTAGLEDWVADSVDDYVSLAIAKAGDLGALSELRAGLRERVLATPLFDAARFAQGLVRALREFAA